MNHPYQPNLPWRFRESTFRLYESTIATIVEQFPTPVTFNPTVSTETFSCRLRDAMNSLKEHNWTTFINMQRFFLIHPQVRVCVRGTQVIAGDVRAIQMALKKTIGHEPAVGVVRETLVDPREDLLLATITLHHYRLRTEPTVIRFTQPRDLKAEEWETKYDVAIDTQPDGSFLLL